MLQLDDYHLRSYFRYHLTNEPTSEKFHFHYLRALINRSPDSLMMFSRDASIGISYNPKLIMAVASSVILQLKNVEVRFHNPNNLFLLKEDRAAGSKVVNVVGETIDLPAPASPPDRDRGRHISTKSTQ